MSIQHRVKPRYRSKNDQIVAELRDAAGAGPPIDPLVRVKRLTAEVAVQMALLHGGDWKPVVDHEQGYVLVSRRPPWEQDSQPAQ